MRYQKLLMVGVLGLALSIALVATADDGTGGLPTLANRVTALQTKVNALEGAIAFISMNADGSVNYSKGVDASNPLTTGKFPNTPGGYQVLLTHDVSQCVAVANVHPGLGLIVPAFAMVSRSSSTQVSIAIFKYDGTPMDAAFELAVFCQ